METTEDGVQMKLELVPVPVADVERAVAFYVERLGFTLDVDVRPAEGVRVVQVSPTGSSCSIGLGSGLPAYDGHACAAEDVGERLCARGGGRRGAPGAEDGDGAARG